MDIEEAKSLLVGQVIYTPEVTNRKGVAWRWKVNGMVKEWKRSPGRVQVPLKHGLYDYTYLTEANMRHFVLKMEGGS